MYDQISAHQIKWLTSRGVPLSSITDPIPLQYSENLGLYFPDIDAFWNPRTDAAMSPDWAIGTLSTGTLSDPIIIQPSVIEWLKSGRAGIVVLRWSELFDQLYGFDAVSPHPDILEKYNHYMQPRLLPRIIDYGSI